MASSLFDLTGRRALITGSSQGIGFALAEALGEHGAKLVLNGRDEARLGHAVETFSARGFDVVGMAFDVTDPESVEKAVSNIEDRQGPVDILVNNAGMQYRTPLEDFPHDRWEELLRTNISSVFYVAQAVARYMISRGEGRIVNIASVQSELARTGIAPYTATKGAVRNLTRGMAADWARKGLQINAIAPGYFKTPLNKALIENPDFSAWLENRTPAGRWGDVEELKGAVVFLASDAASFVNGHTLYVDGGLTVSL